MNYYFIDLENVNNTGLLGIDKLPINDQVYIFCGASNSVNIPVHILCSIKCETTWIKMKKIASNYLDFQLSMFVAQLVIKQPLESNDCIFIISKDKGFSAAKDFLEKQKINVVLQERIDGVTAKPNPRAITKPHSSALKNTTKSEVRKILADSRTSKSSQRFNDVYGAIRSSESVEIFREWVKKGFPNKLAALEKCFYLERAIDK